MLICTHLSLVCKQPTVGLKGVKLFLCLTNLASVCITCVTTLPVFKIKADSLRISNTQVKGRTGRNPTRHRRDTVSQNKQEALERFIYNRKERVEQTEITLDGENWIRLKQEDACKHVVRLRRWMGLKRWYLRFCFQLRFSLQAFVFASSCD